MAFKRFPDEEIFHVQRFDHFPRVFLKSLNLSNALLNCGHPPKY